MTPIVGEHVQSNTTHLPLGYVLFRGSLFERPCPRISIPFDSIISVRLRSGPIVFSLPFHLLCYPRKTINALPDSTFLPGSRDSPHGMQRHGSSNLVHRPFCLRALCISWTHTDSSPHPLGPGSPPSHVTGLTSHLYLSSVVSGTCSLPPTDYLYHRTL